MPKRAPAPARPYGLADRPTVPRDPNQASKGESNLTSA